MSTVQYFEEHTHDTELIIIMTNETIHSTNGLQPDLNLWSVLTGNIVLCTLHKSAVCLQQKNGEIVRNTDSYK